MGRWLKITRDEERDAADGGRRLKPAGRKKAADGGRRLNLLEGKRPPMGVGADACRKEKKASVGVWAENLPEVKRSHRMGRGASVGRKSAGRETRERGRPLKGG